MATINTSQYLDSGTARTAGEAHAIGSGAVLTIRTDSRIHANAPASFTGSLGNPTFTDIGGELLIDARNVRWLEYDTGSGNAPAIGTTISQGGVSGYLLGVWPDYRADITNITVLHLHCDGADNSTTVTDNSLSANTCTCAGNARIRTAVSQFGGASLYFDGTGDWVTVGTSGAFNFDNAEDLTLEGWVYCTTAMGATNRPFWSNGYGFRLGVRNSTIELKINDVESATGEVTITGPASSIAQNTWAHFAAVRKEGTWTVFVGGVPGTGVFSAKVPSTAVQMYLGMHPDAANFYTGYLDELRIVRGKALYTADFSASLPSAAYPHTPPSPVAVGAAIPATGFLKFREVTGGAFAAGALTGISASAVGADVLGWIEQAWDAATNFVVPRVGKITTRGGWFEIGTTDGNRGQRINVPTSSAQLKNNAIPGVWVETAEASGVYGFWPGLSSAANMWIRSALGHAAGYSDDRTKFVKAFPTGSVVFGEKAFAQGTYVTTTQGVGTYADIAMACTYTWAADVVTVSSGATAHLLETGMQTYLDFTSGAATDGTFTITVLDAYTFTVPLAGSGAGGNVTSRHGLTVTVTAHALMEGESTYCDFTTGTGVDGTYQIYSVDSANAFKIAYPHSAAITGGNVTVNGRITVTLTSHSLAVGKEVYLDFLTGGATDGKYVVAIVDSADAFKINYPFAAAIATSDVAMKFDVGTVPPANCRVRIPNVFMAECATAARATNTVPNATIASRPEFATTTAGAVDLEYVTAISMRSIFAQAYSVRLAHCALQETLDISECATALDITDVGIGSYSAQDARAVQLTSNFAGGTVSDVVALRPTIGTTDHAFESIYCRGVTFNNLKAGIIGYARSSGIAVSISTSQNLVFNGVQAFNGNVLLATSVGIQINDLDYNDRFLGHTNATTPYNAVVVGAGCDDITVDGITCGLNGTLVDCHPYTGMMSVTAATNVKLRNVGDGDNYVSTGVWAPNAYAMGVAVTGSGNNDELKVQKLFVGKLRTAMLTTVNSDKNITLEQLLSSSPYLHSAKAVRPENMAWLNAKVKGLSVGTPTVTGQTSVYGTHWMDVFRGDDTGVLILAMNEPTAETVGYYTNVAGVVKFNSSGGVEMRAVGAQSIWEMDYFAQGHTGFANVTPAMSGGTIGNYTLEYQLDTGSGYGGTWKTLNTTNLTAETISPTTGFKLKLRITTGTVNSTAITFVRIFTTTTTAAQNAIDYPLGLVTVTLLPNVSLTGAEIRVYDMDDTPTGSLGTELAGVESSGAGFSFQTTESNTVWIQVMKDGYHEFGYEYTTSTEDVSLPITLQADINT